MTSGSTSRLFEAARTQTRIIDLRAKVCDLAAIVRAQVEAQRAAAPGRTIRITLEADGPIWVLVDAVRITQVLSGYLTNAVTYSPADRPVDIFVDEYMDQVCVAIHDQGCGLSPYEQALAWNMVYRAPGVEPQVDAKDRAGSSLSLCKTIIECHGGKVGIESAVGAGATFWFTLPLVEEPL